MLHSVSIVEVLRDGFFELKLASALDEWLRERLVDRGLTYERIGRFSRSLEEDDLGKDNVFPDATEADRVRRQADNQANGQIGRNVGREWLTALWGPILRSLWSRSSSCFWWRS